MLTAYYVHRLPADYETTRIHARARERGARWDDAPDLYFKAFLLREAGQYGASENSYASFYLWRGDAALRSFLLDGHYENVTKSFGRAPIQTQLAIDARRGTATTARFARLDEIDIPADANLHATLLHEIEQNRVEAGQRDVVARAISVDTLRWRITRLTLLDSVPETNEPNPQSGASTLFQVVHLAKPLLHTL
ncbi:DUF4865 family protein [Paraburkholderia sp.]|uniref:DUF4865 family protein n=1 Tax=Paraburkholderia sp. TaxID=1926495 RepID=UPI00286F6449|nr:DUF4865 family protein [Paraburkholderia sp.]